MFISVPDETSHPDVRRGSILAGLIDKWSILMKDEQVLKLSISAVFKTKGGLSWRPKLSTANDT